MNASQKRKLLLNLLALVDHQNRVEDAPAVLADKEQLISQAIDDALAESNELELRRVTILWSDLRGFTTLAETHTTKQTVEALNRYFTRMSQIILKYGGTIDKFMGDAILVLFGAPLSKPNDIDAALACAIEMQEAMEDINIDNKARGMESLFMGIGINTGDVMVGYLGSALHNEYTAIGDQVNIASRVMTHCLRGQILLGENTYQQARGYIEIGDVNEVKVKGKSAPIRMYELLGVEQPEKKKAPQREMRSSPRVEVDMQMSFQTIKNGQVMPHMHDGQIMDLGYGGMRLISPVKVEPFDNILVHALVSISTKTEVYAKILRVVPLEDKFECRVEFTSIDTKASLAIKHVVDQMIVLNRY